jgi:hypothetical protein
MKFTPANSTRTSASPAPGDGTGTWSSFIASAPPGAWTRIARIWALVTFAYLRDDADSAARDGAAASRDYLGGQLPLLAIVFIVIGASIVVKLLMSHAR